MPNNKKLEQSSVQKEVKIVKVKQEKKIPDKSNKKEDLSIQAVSYTHLDVYKRQIYSLLHIF